MRVLTFEQYCAEHGVDSLPDTLEFHKLPNLSGRARERVLVHGQRAGKQWYMDRIRLDAEYKELVEKGEIRPPTRRERLEYLASGDPDSQQTQAAKRLLAKER